MKCNGGQACKAKPPYRVDISGMQVSRMRQAGRQRRQRLCQVLLSLSLPQVQPEAGSFSIKMRCRQNYCQMNI